MTLATAQQAIAQQQALLAGTPFRSPPPLPTSCCGKGCAGCVWEAYFSAVGYWLDDAAATLPR